jgi:RHS repeat-associated protein
MAQQPHLLNLDNGSGGSLLSGGASAGGQFVQLDAVQRGVTASGASRVGTPFGWALNADPGAVDEVDSRMFGPIDLVTGAVTYSDTQLVLPAYAPWPIGVSYNSARTSGTIGLDYQGNDWFQCSQPSISQADSHGVIRLFYAANAFVEYRQVDSSNYYAGINGAGGLMISDTAVFGDVEEETTPVFRLLDQAGTEIVFFGFDTGLYSNGAAGQIWKYTVCKGTKTGVTEQTAYVGHIEKPRSAANSGYSGGHIVFARDSAGRKFEYNYTSIGGTDRLTSVVAKAAGSSPPTIATVEYAYYGGTAIGNTTTNNGSDGDLALVRVTLPTSFPAAGSDPAIEDVRENRFYYDTDSRVKLVLGYEGTRRHLVAAGGSPVSWDANSSTLATALNSRAELRVAYSTTSGMTGKVASAWFAGMDGNNDQPSGEHQFTYEDHGSYTTPWQWRTIVKLPQFSRYAGSSLTSSSTESNGNAWTTQYFDELGQPLHTVASDIDPASTGSTPRYWVTGVKRDSSYRLLAVHTPANCSAYDHNAASASRGSYTTSSSAGPVTYFERYGSSSKYEGLVYGSRRGAGTGTSYGGTNYVSWSDHEMREVRFSTSPRVELLRPTVHHVRAFPGVTTSPTGGSYTSTEYNYTWWTGSPGTVVVRELETVLPAVSSTHNGTGSATTKKVWFSHLGQIILEKMPNGRLNSAEYDATAGLPVKHVLDASTPSSTNLAEYADLATPPSAATLGGESGSDAYNVTTTFGHDVLGRMVQTTSSAEAGSSGSHTWQAYFTRLSDRRIARMEVPAVNLASTPVYYGPISVSVVNHLGVVEESGSICPSNPTIQPSSNPSAFSTTSVPRTWLAEPTSTLAEGCLTKAQHYNTASGSPALVSFLLLKTSYDGSRVVESRVYASVPTSGTTIADWQGSLNTDGNNHHYDRTLTRYNGMGRVDREQDFTDTIDRYGFDTLARTVQHVRGTIESGTGANMRPVSSVVYDGTDYSTPTASLNVAGANGEVTQVWKHPSGSIGATNDMHSFVRHNPLGQAANYWGDEGPFLAVNLDNMGRSVAAAAFDGVLSGWSGATSPLDPTSYGSSTIGFRNRFAENLFDELGRVYRNMLHAVDPTNGHESGLTSPDTMFTNRYFGANGALKFKDGSQPTVYARDRLCRVKTQAVVASNWSSGSVDLSEATGASMAHQIVVSQTNIYRDANHHNIIATVSAERGTRDVDSTGTIVTGSDPLVLGPLMDVPNNPSQTGWLGINPPSGGSLHWALPSGVAPSWLLLNVQTTDHDRWLDVPFRLRDFGDPLRHPVPPHTICCGANCDPGSIFPAGPVAPFFETDLEYDPRRVICKTTTSDWESGDRRISATFRNMAGQPLKSMAIKQRFDPSGFDDLPAVPEDQLPLSPSGGCCNTAERNDQEWDKGRLKLERMFLCDHPDPDSGTPGYQFNPLSPTEYCGPASTCPKTTSYGYPDYPADGGGGVPYPWTLGDPYMPPRLNDNNRIQWTVKPIGESPDANWHRGKSDGSDDADWYVYDDLGRLLRQYGHAYRSTLFGDGNAVSGTAPADHIYWSRGGYPTEVVRPSGDHTKPWEHQFTERDMLGRPKRISHILDGFALGGSPAWDDQQEFSYDKFGMLSEYKQKFKGMYPSSCGPSGDWLVCGIVREGTPQQPVRIGNPTTGPLLTPWQGSRIVRQTLPEGKELGMAYFPDPSGTTDATMFPTGAGGADGLLMELRLNWALGRQTGLFEGDGTDHFSTPIAQYGYLGMAVPLRRYLPTPDMEKWLIAPFDYAPANDGSGGGGFVPLDRNPPDYRHRLRDDMWGRPIDVNPSAVPPQLVHKAEGHEDIHWMSGRITSYMDPATSPDFGSGGVSPVGVFSIFGHDEFYRHDCQGRTIYWLSGQASKWTKSSAQTAWEHGLTSPTGVNSSNATTPTNVTEAEFRWQTPDTGCGTTGGNGGWLIAPDGEFNVDHPLSPKNAGGGTEWAQHPIPSVTEECSPLGINSRIDLTLRQQTSGSSVNNVTGWPFHDAYDAAGNLRSDGRHWFVYDGANRLRDVYRETFNSGGDPIQGTHLAHFDYDGLGRHLKSIYDTDGDGSLTDEDVEWTPRDLLGRPLGIWRQGPEVSGARPCTKPYQMFGYHSTGFGGTGYDSSGGILDCPAIRWRDADGESSNGLEETLYYLQDFRGDITALAGDTKHGVLERVRYGMTGRPEAFPPADVNFDGVVNSDDKDSFEAALAAFGSSPGDYDPRADFNHDGAVDGADEDVFTASYDKWVKWEGNWKLSQGDGLTPGGTGDDAGLDNRFGWRGYWWDAHLQKYHVKNRVYDPREGRWMQNDPLGFDAGDQDLYRYANGEYSTGYDPLGLESGAGTTATVTMGDDCGCGDAGGASGNGGGSGGGSHDPFEQFGVGDDRLNENTRAGQRERPEGADQFGRNVTAVSNGLNNGIAGAFSNFFGQFSPTKIMNDLKDGVKRFNALGNGDIMPMVDHYLEPFRAAAELRQRWDNASEDERYYMVAYGMGYVAADAAIAYATGKLVEGGMGAWGEWRAMRGAGSGSAIVGRSGGQVLTDAEQMATSARLRKFGIETHWGDTATSKLINRRAMFDVEDGKGVLHFRWDATRYERKHELYHMNDWLRDKNGYMKMTPLEREESVYRQLRQRDWGWMTDSERDHATKYIEDCRKKWGRPQ